MSEFWDWADEHPFAYASIALVGGTAWGAFWGSLAYTLGTYVLEGM